MSNLNCKQVFSHITDFGGALVGSQEEMFTPNEEENTSKFVHDQEALEENDMNFINVTPLVDAAQLYTDPIASPIFNDIPENEPAVTSIVRDEIPSPRMPIIDNVPITRAVNEVPYVDQPDELKSVSSHLTDDNNNSTTSFAADNDDDPMQPDVNDINPQTTMTADETLVQPDDDIPIGLEPLASPTVPEIVNHMPNDNDTIPLSPVNSEPFDIQPPILEISQPLITAPKRKRQSVPKKRRRTIFADDVTTLDSTEMRERVANTTIGCKPPRADIMSKAETLSHIEAKFFTEPTMDGQINRPLFKRSLILNDAENDLSIIHDILDITHNEQPDHVENRVQDTQVIEGDAIRRRSSRKRKSPYVEPCSQQQFVEETAFISPADPIVDNVLPEIAPRSQKMSAPVPGDQPVEQQSWNTPASTGGTLILNENDKSVLRKLRMLWKQNVYPVAMENITSSKSNRLQSAKNFASILGKKWLKKGL